MKQIGSPSVISVASHFSIIDLFRNKQTRYASLALLIGFLLAYCTFLFQLYQSENDLVLTKRQKDTSLEEKDMSQTVMAVHIGLLRRQLIDEGINPIPTQQALKFSRHFLTLKNKGFFDDNLHRYVDHKSLLYRLIPLHSDYDPSRIFKYD
ncbi:hypothetical protein FOA43_003786 [Brettanomyces nanus]|uniref:Uncharacterized protein n=1 Tax=Eeniella nana TaxID=13502 RepID=A0A875RWM8_EENNA|nr:uncharacterized protein FOA43_003786 [Brettanomyces nanus]QPG76397.1 hypothetical protein FOA43_003786 [Brettanomyces nanus]